MQQDLALLLDLQEIDDELGELERSKIYLPEMILKLESEISELEKEIAESGEIVQDSVKEQKALELEIEADKEKIENYQRQMIPNQQSIPTQRRRR